MLKRPTMIGLTNEALVGFSSDNAPPCLSLYQPTHRRHPENQQDPIRFRKLVKELEASLRQKFEKGAVEGALSRFSDRITRVEVHLSDDKRCMMEARLEGRQPTAVTHQAASLEGS